MPSATRPRLCAQDVDEEAERKKEEMKRQVLGDEVPICAMRPRHRGGLWVGHATDGAGSRRQWRSGEFGPSF